VPWRRAPRGRSCRGCPGTPQVSRGSLTPASPCPCRSQRRSASPTCSCSTFEARRGGGDLRRGSLFLRRRRRDNPLYYIPVQGVAGNQARVPATCP
jgi:hypothetical protein